MEKNDWLHNFGAGVLTVFLMLSPIICLFSWKWAFTSTSELEKSGYVVLAIVSSVVTWVGAYTMYCGIKENL